MAKLRLIFVNNSGTPGHFVVYQRSEKETLAPLAWQSQFAYPGTSVRVEWNDRAWNYAWGPLTQINPGTVFTAAQLVPAEPANGNQIELLQGDGDTLDFTNQKNGAAPGYFVIVQAPSVPLNSAAVGLGMDGKTAFAGMARPNSRIVFNAQVSYWVTFGDMAEGEFLFDVATLPSARVDFRPGVQTVIARLNPDFSWTIEEESMTQSEETAPAEAAAAQADAESSSS